MSERPRRLLALPLLRSPTSRGGCGLGQRRQAGMAGSLCCERVLCQQAGTAGACSGCRAQTLHAGLPALRALPACSACLPACLACCVWPRLPAPQSSLAGPAEGPLLAAAPQEEGAGGQEVQQAGGCPPASLREQPGCILLHLVGTSMPCSCTELVGTTDAAGPSPAPALLAPHLLARLPTCRPAAAARSRRQPFGGWVPAPASPPLLGLAPWRAAPHIFPGPCRRTSGPHRALPLAWFHGLQG